MKTNYSITVGAMVSAMLSLASVGMAANATWINLHGDFNTPANWSTGIVPGAGDNAVFTNTFSGQVVSWSAGATNANISFTDLTGAGNGPGGFNIAPSTMYVVTNRFLVDGLAAGSPYIINYNAGNTFVTNADGTAELLVGPTGKGTFSMNGGTFTADRLTVTNGANSVFTFFAGTLNTLHGSSIIKPLGNGQFIGQFAATINWNMLGGTNFLDATGGTILGQSSGASAGIVTVNGAGTLWTNTGSVYVGNGGIGSKVTISNGGRVDSPGAVIGNNSGANSNTVIVTDSNSLWNTTTASVLVGAVGSYNRLILTNGGRLQNLVASNVSIGNGLNSSNNIATVTGANSQWNAGPNNLIVGYQGQFNQLNVDRGGNVAAGSLTVGQTTGSGNNSVTITGSNSAITVSGAVSIGALKGNSLTVADGGTFSSVSATAYIGNGSSSSGNVVTVTGPGSMWTNNGAIWVGNQGFDNKLVVTNGGKVYDTEGRVGGQVSTFGSVAIVTGSNSLWQNSGDMIIGRQLAGNNQLIVSDGGMVKNANAYLGMFSAATYTNKATVTGAGSVWSNSASLIIGNEGSYNEIIIADGGKVYGGTTTLGNFTTATGNKVTVTGTGSVWTVLSTFSIGGSSSGGGWGNQVVVTNGGKIDNTASAFTAIGNGSLSSNNNVLVTGRGSLWDAGANIIRVGSGGSGNSLTVTQDGEVRAHDMYLGSAAGSVNNVILLTEGGTLDTTSIQNIPSNTGTFTNRGGILQFPVYNPLLGPAVAANFVTTNGTISFRSVTNAPVTALANMNYQGNNKFRLNNATNALGLASYTFNTGNPSNYQSLVMINNAGWRSTSLTIGSGGSMLISNSISTVNAALNDQGEIRVVNSIATFSGNATISGKFMSDPSTNIFLGDVQVTGNGSLQGGVGDRFEYKKSLLINSADSSLFDLVDSTVAFTGGNVHTNLVLGDDLGNNGSLGYPDGFLAQNFAYGTLELGLGDLLYFGKGGIDASNALYVTRLLLPNNDTNLVANLRTLGSDVNVYYYSGAAENAYLNNQVYALTGGGFLMPAIPEPSAVLMILSAGALLVRRRIRN